MEQDKEKRLRVLSQCVAEWQNLLKLNEWDIAVGIGTRETMGKNNGSISYVRENGQALLTIIDPKEAIIKPFGYNEEATIVTQLLNLRYEAASDNPNIYLARANKIMANLLVELKHSSDAYHRILQEMEGVEEPAPEPEQPPVKKAPRVINT